MYLSQPSHEMTTKFVIYRQVTPGQTFVRRNWSKIC